MSIEFQPGDIIVFPDQGPFEIASVHLEGPRPIVKYTDGSHTSIRTLTEQIEEGSVSLRAKSTMDIEADLKRLEVHDGDVVLIRVVDPVRTRAMSAFRRSVREQTEALGWPQRGIWACVVNANVEISRADPKRVDVLEARIQKLEGQVAMLQFG